jgi:F-box protein 21
MLDHLAAKFRVEHPDHQGMCTRDSALALNRWLRAQNLTGMDDPQTNYRNLRNCFLGHALRDENHPSLPMISAAIYCCIAGRLGLNAHCCASPGHIHAMIFAPRGVSLDGEPIEDTQQQAAAVDRMYIDPYSTDEEVGRQSLQARIVAVGWQNSMETLLEPVSPATLVERLARNIKATFTASRAPIVAGDQEVANLLQGNPAENLELAVYAAAWASLLIRQHDPQEFGEHSRQLAFWFKAHQIEDVWLIERFYSPLSSHLLGRPSSELAQYIRRIDNRPTKPQYRTQDMKFRIGQVVFHARTEKLAVICGWRKNNGLTFYDIM